MTRKHLFSPIYDMNRGYPAAMRPPSTRAKLKFNFTEPAVDVAPAVDQGFKISGFPEAMASNY
jgi:hypothetical protein